jgi:hypothetical protein
MWRSNGVLVPLLFALLAHCGRDPQATPEGALAAWVAAMNDSRTDITARRRAYDLLAQPARASLAERAARASQLSGREIQPWEMLAPGRFAMRFDLGPEGLQASVQGERATVIVRGPAGERAEVPMVREGERWRVDLALPAMVPIRVDADGGP